jgi:hypothetical protein
MRTGLLVFDEHFLHLVSVVMYRPWCWSVDGINDFFRTNHKVKTQQLVKILGQRCGDIKFAGYLVNVTGPMPLVLDLPNDIDRSLNETVTDKIRKYRTDYNNNPPNVISFMSSIVSMSGRLQSEFVLLLFLQDHREIDRFLDSQEFNLRIPASRVMCVGLIPSG